MKKFRNFLFFAIFSLVLSCGTTKEIAPDVSQYNFEVPEVQKINDSAFVFKQNFLQKNSHRTWEFYNTGNALQLGYNQGALAQKLLQNQEKAFFSKVEELIPSKFRQKLALKVMGWYTRKMPRYIRPDFQAELYSLSRYYSDDYDFLMPKYPRILSLHAAHDIGHAMQDLMIVGCSSLAVWDDRTEDGNLLIGRAFDFYVGDEFAAQKMIHFVKPEAGIPYMSVSWPGMIGVASGMNKSGLTVTINAGKSKIPWSAKTPISLVTREILQYAETIDEAVAIAKKRQVFVSESILVGSAKDHKAVIIEVSPKKFGVYDVPNSDKVLCTNHFQSEEYKDDRRNLNQIKESHSVYRYEKIGEFLDENPKLNPEKMAEILRDRSGLKNKEIGNGNEKSINQLIAHHAVIFSPEKKLAWVSSSPYQLGEFVCYDLDKIFSENPAPGNLEEAGKLIPKDPFLDTEEYRNYEKYRVLDRQLDDATKHKAPLSEDWLNSYKNDNPNLWIVYFKTGKYFYEIGDYDKAKENFETALTKEISSVPERENIEKYLKKTLRKISN